MRFVRCAWPEGCETLLDPAGKGEHRDLCSRHWGMAHPRRQGVMKSKAPATLSQMIREAARDRPKVDRRRDR